MIISEQEYVSILHQINNPNLFFNYIQAPADEKLYKIDLNTKEIEAPDNLGSQGSHNSEIIWFVVDRFFDMRDLSTCACWIEYVNADKESYYFSTVFKPFLDMEGNEKLAIPWVISKEVTKIAGTVEFAFHFYNTIQTNDTTGNPIGVQYSFILNTKAAKSKVLNGISIVAPASDATAYFAESRLEQIEQDLATLAGKYVLYWTGLEI